MSTTELKNKSILVGKEIDLTGKTIPEILSRFVQKNSGKVALSLLSSDGLHITGTVSRGELQMLSNGIACYLLRKNLRPDEPVLICTRRSPEQIAAMIAVIQAGGIFVPIDTDFPPGRIEQIIAVLGKVPLALVDDEGKNALKGTRVRLINVLEAANSPLSLATFPNRGHNDAAYIMFTSGSTGTPKGVVIPQSGILRLVLGLEYVSIGEDSAILHMASAAFDASTLEVWAPLLNGGTCVLYPGGASLDLDLLERVLTNHRLSTLWITASLFNLIIDFKSDMLVGVPTIFTGGEALSVKHMQKAMTLLPNTQFINGYGPTENTTFTCCYLIPKDNEFDTGSGVPLGTPIAGTDIEVWNDNLEPVLLGEVGELVTSGLGVAHGYWNAAERTENQFISAPGARPGYQVKYRTGDHVKIGPDGLVYFVGRKDDQIKLDGNRIELGEVQHLLRSQRDVRDAIALVRLDRFGMRQLVAYVVSDKEVSTSLLKDQLSLVLPIASVPAHIICIDRFPLTSSGKIDRQSLPAPEITNASQSGIDSTDIEGTICDIWKEILSLGVVRPSDDFFKCGGNSLRAIRFVEQWKLTGHRPIPVSQLYDRTTPAKLAQFVTSTAPLVEAELTERETIQPDRDDNKIAIVGMAGRFPGANSVAELWELLLNGEEGISFFRSDELDPEVCLDEREHPRYVAARGIVEGVEYFDHMRFGLTQREAELLDPQQRLLLEIASDTLESANCTTSNYQGRIGVWAGTRSGDYYQNIVSRRPDIMDTLGHFQVSLGNDKDFVASRISYLLGLTGPSVSVYSACSTSLVAVHEAARALIGGECDLALAGGAALTIPQKSGHLYQEGAALSADGHCRPFDASATGTVFSDGAAMVALKRLSDAIKDRDNITAVIIGSAVNNDGGGKASFMAPSAGGQGRVISDAVKLSKATPDSIGFVETHGTATPLGDPIEVDGLVMALGRSDTVTCVLGSVKSNIGHLTAASGVTGLIKAALAVREGIIPATLNFTKVNPMLDLGGRFRVSARQEEFSYNGPRRAGVSSFGVGGTNSHVVLEQPPHPNAIIGIRSAALETPLLCLSAPSVESLIKLRSNLGQFVSAHSEVSLKDIAWTLREGRTAWNIRTAVAGHSKSEIASHLQDKNKLALPCIHSANVKAVLVFPGQGSQYAGMGSGIAKNEPLFRQHLDVCVEAFGEIANGWTLDRVLAPETPEAVIQSTRFAQPALFAVEYALARSWMALGLVPDMLIGHSIGEFVAACLSGIFSLNDAAKLVTERGRLMENIPAGDMLSVRVSEDALDLPETLDLAAVNGNNLCVVSGPPESIESYQKLLNKKAIPNKKLRTSHAFHSRQMEEAAFQFRETLEGVDLKRNMHIPIQSTMSGARLTEDEATSVDYWSNHLRMTVRFSKAIQNTATALGPGITWIECGPGKGAVSAMIRSSLSQKLNGSEFVCGIQEPKRVKPHEEVSKSAADFVDGEAESFATSVGMAWSTGLNVPSRSALGRYRKIEIPTSPYTKQKAWLLDNALSAKNPIKDNTSADAFSDSENQNLSTGALNEAEYNITDNTMGINESSILEKLCKLLCDFSGQPVTTAEADSTFIEIGFDSLLLTQAASIISREFDVEISFRQLNESLVTSNLLVQYLVDNGVTLAAPNRKTMTQLNIPGENLELTTENSVLEMMQNQLIIMQNQINTLQILGKSAPDFSATSDSRPGSNTTLATHVKPELNQPKPHGPQLVLKKVESSEALTDRQKKHLKSLISTYSEKSAKSKSYTQSNRARLADPRTVSSFSPMLKEITYPLVIESSSGCRLIDIDGNEYIDLVSGFGSNFFGFGASFVRDAVTEQMSKSMEIGPQSVLTAKAVSLFQELVPCDRVAFCNTGSEAVLASLRLARTVTGRELVVVFTGGYHGIFDEVVARPTPNGSRPAAPGIPQGAVDNILVLPWSELTAIDEIRTRGKEIAAVLTEPVQSRDPGLQPIRFLQQLRDVTSEIGAALIFDEVVCGFRIAQGGSQQRFGIEADLATYGKVVGGGMPIGVVAGKSDYMDALDGGHWSFGDDSSPTVGVTYFAGTFVRHPPALSAAVASMQFLIDSGPELQISVDEKAESLAKNLSALFNETAAPLKVEVFSSVMKISVEETVTASQIVFHHLRMNGVHILEGRPVFLTMCHSDTDLDFIVDAFRIAIRDLQRGGFFPEPVQTIDAESPPLPGAKLGRNAEGAPTWYIADPESPSGFRPLNTQ